MQDAGEEVNAGSWTEMGPPMHLCVHHGMMWEGDGDCPLCPLPQPSASPTGRYVVSGVNRETRTIDVTWEDDTE
jgi:hypothetical protein